MSSTADKTIAYVESLMGHKLTPAECARVRQIVDNAPCLVPRASEARLPEDERRGAWPIPDDDNTICQERP